MMTLYPATPASTLNEVRNTLNLLRAVLALQTPKAGPEARCSEYAVLRLREADDYLRQWVELLAEGKK